MDLLENVNYFTLLKGMSTQDQLDVWQQILGKYVNIGQTFTNPFRLDKNPGCFLREHNGIYFLTDYAFPEYSKFTCIHAIAKLKHCNFNEASWLIYASLLLNKPMLFNNHVETGKSVRGRKSGLKIHFEPWTKDGKPAYTKWDKDYWEGTNVTQEDLIKSQFYSVHHFYLDDKLIVPKYPTYAYVNNGKVKLHQTQETKENRFFGNTGLNTIWTWNEQYNTSLLTKSCKDGLILSKILPMKIIVFNAEETLPDYDNIDYILMDNDETGYKASTKACAKYNGEALFLSSAKDPYDVIKQHGMDKLLEELKTLKLL